MKILTIYLKQEEIIYSINSKKGVINKEEIESLVSDVKGGVLNVIISKPDIIFRKLEIPFKSIKKAKLVLPMELEELLPEPVSNFYYFLEIYNTKKDTTSINVYAIKKEIYNYWKEVSLKNRVKLFFYSDTHLFNLLLNRYIPQSQKNYIGIYAIEGYLLVNVVEDNRLSGSFSYCFSEDEISKVGDILKTIVSTEETPLIFVGCEDIKNKLTEEINLKNIEILPNIEKPYLFPYIINNRIYKLRPLNFKKITPNKKIPIYNILLITFFLIVSFIFFTPYFRLPEKERYRKEVTEKMKEEFQKTCPEVTRIVDPLIQIKEKISEKTNKLDIISEYPSVLEIMANTTSLFPDGINVEIEQFTVAANNLTIFGWIESLKALENVKDKAINSQKFDNVVIGAISFDEKNRVSFNMTLGIK